jgi:ORF6N domain
MANKPPFPPDPLPVPVELVERRIYLIRGQKVVLDSDLAELYQVETRALIQAVKRNMDRFPEDFMFQLTQEETESLRSQIVISNASRGGRRYLPYAFTEHGALMLSSVLKSKRAVQMSIRVVRVFIGLREMLATHKDLAIRMEKLEAGQKGHASILSVIVEEIKKLKQRPEPPPKRRIGFHIPDKDD